MKCPNCLCSKVLPQKPEGAHWWSDLPAAVVVSRVRCDTCLTHFYRVRGVGWLIRRGVSMCCPFL